MVNLISQGNNIWCKIGTWPSRKLPFECQKIAKNLTFFSKKLTFWKKKSIFRQFFDIHMAIFWRVRSQSDSYDYQIHLKNNVIIPMEMMCTSLQTDVVTCNVISQNKEIRHNWVVTCEPFFDKIHIYCTDTVIRHMTHIKQLCCNVVTRVY